MGLFDKLKNVLFEEEDVNVASPKENKLEPEKRIEKEIEPVVESIPQPVKTEVPISRKIEEDEFFERKELPKLNETRELEIDIPERDDFTAKSTFEFPIFDENDFKTQEIQKRPTEERNYQRSTSKKISFGKYDSVTSPTATVEEPKFKPTPVVSPIFGIIGDDNKKIEIEQPKTPIITRQSKKPKTIDIDYVRNKAYGTLEDEINDNVYEEEVKEDISTLEVNNSFGNKSIDDLLFNTVDETISVREEIEKEEQKQEQEEVVLPKHKHDEQELTQTLNILDDIEQELNKSKKTKEEKLEGDNLENDLFNLIDSMYDTRKDEE